MATKHQLVPLTRGWHGPGLTDRLLERLGWE